MNWHVKTGWLLRWSVLLRKKRAIRSVGKQMVALETELANYDYLVDHLELEEKKSKIDTLT